jgi:hypothetical protein
VSLQFGIVASAETLATEIGSVGINRRLFILISLAILLAILLAIPRAACPLPRPPANSGSRPSTHPDADLSDIPEQGMLAAGSMGRTKAMCVQLPPSSDKLDAARDRLERKYRHADPPMERTRREERRGYDAFALHSGYRAGFSDLGLCEREGGS